MFEVNKNPSRSELRKFGWAMLLGFGLLGLALWLLGWWASEPRMELLTWSGEAKQMIALSAWGLGAALCMIGVLAPPGLSKPIYVAWMTVTTRIGMVMSTAALTVLFLVLLPPFSLFIRLGDPLRKKLTRGGTYWEDYKPHEPTLERVSRPF